MIAKIFKIYKITAERHLKGLHITLENTLIKLCCNRAFNIPKCFESVQVCRYTSPLMSVLTAVCVLPAVTGVTTLKQDGWKKFTFLESSSSVVYRYMV
jgi:hypothetical protein